MIELILLKITLMLLPTPGMIAASGDRDESHHQRVLNEVLAFIVPQNLQVNYEFHQTFHVCNLLFSVQ